MDVLDYQQFNKAIDEVWSQKKPKRKNTIINLGQTPEVLKSIGLPDSPMVMNYDKLVNIKAEHPEITLSILKKIPQEINNPTAILKSSTKKNAFIVLTEINIVKKKPVVAILYANRKYGNLEINRLASIYDRNITKISKALNNGDLLYCHEKKFANFLEFHLSRPQGVQPTTMFVGLDKKSWLRGIITNKTIKNHQNKKQSKLERLKIRREKQNNERGR